MPQVTIYYTKPETSKLLKILSKYLDYKILNEKKSVKVIKGESVITHDEKIDISDSKEVFSDRDLVPDNKRSAQARKK